MRIAGVAWFESKRRYQKRLLKELQGENDDSAH